MNLIMNFDFTISWFNEHATAEPSTFTGAQLRYIKFIVPTPISRSYKLF